MSTPKVMIADKLSPRAAAVFRDRGVEAVERVGLSEDELLGEIAGFDGLAVRSATQVTADVIGAADRLKVVGRAGIGVDNIDVRAATQRGIVVMNTPFGNAITTAEHAIAMMFALARQIPLADRSTRAGKWEKSRFIGVELSNKVLGIVGCGNIGSIVAERALGLRMKVLAYDPFLSAERAADIGVDQADLDTLLARADFISLHTPLTEATRGLIDGAALRKCKPGVRIINCARGGLVVEDDLRAAIESGHVAGAALDVFQVEPARDNPLFAQEKVIATPHLGASTAEAQENVALQVAEQMSDFLLTGAVVNALNMPSLSAEDAPRLRPYMALAEQLGSFAGQLTENAVKSIVLEYEGHAAHLNCHPITHAALAGFLAPMLDSVNMVSAPVIARERNIEVTEMIRDRECDFQTLIRLTVSTERHSRSIAGTLFGGDKPRLVEIKGIEMEAELGRYMLYITNQDKPGLIGNLGKVLGDAGVNIATFHLGRAERGADAIALIEVDEPLSDEIIAQVRALPLVVQVKALRF